MGSRRAHVHECHRQVGKHSVFESFALAVVCKACMLTATWPALVEQHPADLVSTAVRRRWARDNLEEKYQDIFGAARTLADSSSSGDEDKAAEAYRSDEDRSPPEDDSEVPRTSWWTEARRKGFLSGSGERALAGEPPLFDLLT